MYCGFGLSINFFGQKVVPAGQSKKFTTVDNGLDKIMEWFLFDKINKYNV